ncbi:MAG: class I SAM-dependent methyltransferase [Chloroflexota bacterium]|nr:class I SAM-dependent methyltransferase [Chloroflexota bacterium]
MPDDPTLNDEVRQQWNQKADFWDNLHGDEGNAFHRHLVSPAAEKLLAIQSGESVLDIACGNGAFARRLADLGAAVVATDISEKLIARAQARSEARAIDYRVVDATKEAALLTLGEARFDAAVCNMALMDMASIQPMLRAVRRLLKPAGRFVFTVMHPCFNSAVVTMLIESAEQEGRVSDKYALKLYDYLSVGTRITAGAPNEPNAHYVFHRPLHTLLNQCFGAGFMLDGVEEPAFGAGVESRRLLSWVNFTQFPPVFAARLRPTS